MEYSQIKQFHYLGEKYPKYHKEMLNLRILNYNDNFKSNETFLKLIKPDCQDDKILITQLLMELDHVT